MLQEVHDFVEFLLRSVDPSHVFERHIRALAFFKDLRLRFADVEDLASTRSPSTKAAHQKHPHHHHQSQENDPRQNLTTPFVGRVVPQVKPVTLLEFFQVGLVRLAVGNIHGGICARIQHLQQLGLRLPPRQAVSDLFGEKQARRVSIVGDALDLARFHHLFEFRPLDALLRSRLPHHGRRQQQHRHDGINPIKIHWPTGLVPRLSFLAGLGVG